VLYPYVLYPVVLALLVRLRPRPIAKRKGWKESVSIVLSAYNEEASIGRRILKLQDLLHLSEMQGEIIVVSDGSTDRTAEIARLQGAGEVRVLDFASNCGKAAALSAGCEVARNDILVFADTRQSWDSDSLRFLVENFSDPMVGAVSGDLLLESNSGVTAGVSLYWRYEKWVRRQESKVHSTVGVTGAISAVRRKLFRPIPPGTILDDVYWPLIVAMQGFRVIHDDRARAYDRLPEKSRDEFRRKVRTLSGNFQLCALLPAALLPWRNPLWFQFISHKVFRLLVPWALMGFLASALVLRGPLYSLLLGCQVAFYALALLSGWEGAVLGRRVATAAGAFVLLNVAAWVAFWVWLSGKAVHSWHKVNYEVTAQTPPAS
jgi:cellulose synthase/poly-beta-1,6-N-acetylglucosamine synthase-like glycosyltransferase